MGLQRAASFETRSGETVLRPDGILLLRIKPGGAQTLADAYENLATVLTASAGQRWPLLLDSSQAALDHAVRQCYVDSEHLAQTAWALALLVGSALEKFMVRLSLLLSSAQVPTRVFTSEEEALAWLRMFHAAEPPCPALRSEPR